MVRESGGRGREAAKALLTYTNPEQGTAEPSIELMEVKGRLRSKGLARRLLQVGCCYIGQCLYLPSRVNSALYHTVAESDVAAARRPCVRGSVFMRPSRSFQGLVRTACPLSWCAWADSEMVRTGSGKLAKKLGPIYWFTYLAWEQPPHEFTQCLS